ncbi:MAG: glycoside hydrolase family 2 [Tannerellaceae bacterium]|jgi:beta-galactosidase|nr:glycoside hydrolase family 2 [Tannerellaceae bacterium]
MNRQFLSLFFVCLFVCAATKGQTEHANYPYPFNPIKGMVHEEEKPFRQELCLNGSWDFMPLYEQGADDFRLPASFRKEEVSIKIPSPWNVNAFTDGQGGDFIAYPSYPKAWEKASIGWMRKSVQIPAEWSGKQLILHLEAVMGKMLLYVNGQKVAENFELFLPFEADITAFLKAGQANEILIGVAKGSLFDDRGKYGRRTYVGGSMWGIEMAGIWQDVYLFAYPPVYISDVFVQPDVKNKQLRVELEINNTTAQAQTLTLDADVKKWYNLAGRSIHESPGAHSELAAHAALRFTARKLSLPPHSQTRITIEQAVSDELALWTPETPNLYGLVLSLNEGQTSLDRRQERFGWRQFLLAGDRLLLNGQPILLKGDSWHFTGVPQMTRRYPWAWFTMLKEAHANAVRLHAQPFPRFYLDVADEMGICVLDETGIWSSDGGPKIDSEAYWESCASHLKQLIQRDKNHPSVFGWSVCNETIPVAVNVFKAPEEWVQRQVNEINRWVKIVQEADPTRPWISGDGETDRPTELPTVIGHYGGPESLKKWSESGLPWGIGEQGMAYYGTPRQAAQYNGKRAYESMQGRMEAIAIEAYQLIKEQREKNASYSSVFNIVWYGLKPLPLGMKDERARPALSDGIFFGFREGAYGMQPERLGPFTSTLNPGYDDALPLYRTWPLFDAIRNANASPPLPYAASLPPQDTPLQSVEPADVVVLYAQTDSKLREELENAGLKFATDARLTPRSLVIIDGANPPADLRASTNKLKKALAAGARVCLMGFSPQTKAFINAFLPYPVELEERKATSFLKQANPLWLQGLQHADFYFSELIPRGGTAMHYGLSGDFAAKATPWLLACNTDWQRWNSRPETSKTANVFRSELETKGSALVIASIPSGKGEIILSTLDLSPIALESRPLLIRMLENAGATFSADKLNELKALDSNARLHRSLSSADQSRWDVIVAGDKGIFRFPRGTRSREVYLSFWIYSPRSLSNLLVEPDMPALDMLIETQSSLSVLLNDKPAPIDSSKKEEARIPLALDKGWNQIEIKLANPATNAAIEAGVRLESTDKKYLSQLLSALRREG